MKITPPLMDNNRGLISFAAIEDGFENKETTSFWKQPNELGYKPCLQLRQEYQGQTRATVGERTKYLMVLVNRGMNQ